MPLKAVARNIYCMYMHVSVRIRTRAIGYSDVCMYACG